MTHDHSEVVILTKAPHPGRVKTRLAPALGLEGAAALHRLFVDHTLSLVAASGLPVTVAVGADPDDAFAGQLRARGLAVVPQATGDLGARMRALIAGSSRRRVLIGTDCPLFAPAWLVQAVQAPQTVAIAPSEDGGYWAISVDPCAPSSVLDALFDQMTWSTPQVLSTTLSRLSRLGVPAGLLPTAWDIDEPKDLVRLLRDPRCPAILRSHLSHLPTPPC